MWRAISVPGQIVWSAPWVNPVTTIACQLLFCYDCCSLAFAYCITTICAWNDRPVVIIVCGREILCGYCHCLLTGAQALLSFYDITVHDNCYYLSWACLFVYVQWDLSQYNCVSMVIYAIFIAILIRFPPGPVRGGAHSLGGNCGVRAYGTHLSCRKLSVQSFGTCRLKAYT